MAYKQPRVPPYNEGTSLYSYIRELILFLKDFCMETWAAAKRIDAKCDDMGKSINNMGNYAQQQINDINQRIDEIIEKIS